MQGTESVAGSSHTGRFFDGRSALPVPVSVTVGITSLHLTATAGDLDAIHPDHRHWPFDDLHILSNISDRLILGAGSDEGVRLIIEGADSARLAQQLKAHVKDKSTLGGWRQGGAVSAALIGFAACVVLAVWQGASLIPYIVTNDMEQAFGGDLAAGFADSMGQCTTTRGQAALAKMSTALVGARANDLTLHVLDTEIVNAAALPGGHILIFRGLIDLADSPEMVAGVLAHEIAHNDLRHPIKGLARQLGLNLAIEVLTGGSGLSGLVGTLAILKNSRDFERDADARAIQILLAAGQDPSVLSDFFIKLRDYYDLSKLTEKGESKTDAKSEPTKTVPDAPASESADGEGVTVEDDFFILRESLSDLSDLLSTHPSSKDRVALLNAQARPQTKTLITDKDWTAIKNMCR